MAIIHNVRGGTVGLNEEERLMIARLLVTVNLTETCWQNIRRMRKQA